MIAIEPSGLMKYVEAETTPRYQHWLDGPPSAFSQEGLGASCAPLLAPGALPCMQGWVLGVDKIANAPPVFPMDAGLLRALLPVKK